MPTDWKDINGRGRVRSGEEPAHLMGSLRPVVGGCGPDRGVALVRSHSGKSQMSLSDKRAPSGFTCVHVKYPLVGSLGLKLEQGYG